MGYTDTMLDQARAKLGAGEAAAAWELTTAIAKAEPENVRAWELMADIIAPVSPERASKYREKARAAAMRSAPQPGGDQPQPGAPAMPYQPSPAKLQLGQDIAQAEGDLALHQNNLRALERHLAAARGSRTGGSVVFFIGLFCLIFFFGVWPLWIIMLIAGAMAAASAGTRIDAIEKDIRAAEAAITDIQQQLARLRMRFGLMV
ncbi:MAG TPA: hypothetical protein VD886_04475 [Herpetosiphonaceae bacterium]|nr:hypothetical protein [Herpetosiphonaceae bacterium]